MTPDQFRALALSMEGALEGSHFGHADFRARKGIFATLGSPDARYGMVKLSREQQEMLMAVHPAVFSPAKGAWGRQGSTLVTLAEADTEMLEGPMRMAWKGRGGR